MKIVATFVSASSQGNRTHSARTKILLHIITVHTKCPPTSQMCPSTGSASSYPGLVSDKHEFEGFNNNTEGENSDPYDKPSIEQHEAVSKKAFDVANKSYIWMK